MYRKTLPCVVPGYAGRTTQLPQAQQVRFFKVNVQGPPTEIRLSVRDSGVGFEPESAKGTQGLGLISMRERVRLVNGSISITSSPRSGAEVRICVPLLAGKPMEKISWQGPEVLATRD